MKLSPVKNIQNEANETKESKKTKKHSKSKVIWISTVCSLIILISVAIFTVIIPHGGQFLVVHGIDIYARSQSYEGKAFIDNRVAIYTIIHQTSNKDSYIGFIKGDYLQTVGGAKIYKIKNQDNLNYLIFDYGEKLAYAEFDHFYFTEEKLSDEDLYKSIENLLFIKDWEKIKNTAKIINFEPYNLEYVLKTIYGVDSPSDIEKVKFSKTTFDNTAEAKAIKVKTVYIKDENEIDIKEFYKIISNLKISSNSEIESKANLLEKTAEENGISQVVTNRIIEVFFKNGVSMKLIYSPLSGFIYKHGMVYYEFISDEENAWLMEKAQIEIDWFCVFDSYQKFSIPILSSKTLLSVKIDLLFINHDVNIHRRASPPPSNPHF